jgi:hypothetical protein
MIDLHNPSGCTCLRRRRRPGLIAATVLSLRIAYYRRALSDMTLAHPDASAVLLHLSSLRAKLDGAR